MKNPKTTIGAILLALATLFTVASKALAGNGFADVDWSTVALTIMNLLAAVGLYKAVDPGGTPPVK